MLGGGVKIGRLFGITIRVDWSWLFIFLLITWNLSSVFGQIRPDWSVATRWGLSLLASLLFFLSVLAHELAHSLVARAQGLPVRNITLFMFGGVSNIQREPDTPKHEFLMAIAGPITSLVLGAAMLLIAANSLNLSPGSIPDVGQLAANLDPLSLILLWIGMINIVLAIFNLIPGFPLDGGRVLRSIFWAATNNLRTATRWAALVGQIIAWAMIIAGIAMAFGVQIPFFGTGLLNGLWLAFIGWFLSSASQQSYQQVAIKDLLEGVPVTRLMRTDPPTVTGDITVYDLVHRHVMGTDDQAFPVLDEGKLAGIVTLDDVRKSERDDWSQVYVKDIMTPGYKLVTAGFREDGSDALEKLLENEVRQLPVINNKGELLGLLRRTDIMRYLQVAGTEKEQLFDRPTAQTGRLGERYPANVRRAEQAEGRTAPTGGLVPQTGRVVPEDETVETEAETPLEQPREDREDEKYL